MGNAFDVIIRAGKRVFVFGLFVLSLMGCSALLQHAKTRTPNPAATVASTNTTYQISLEKNFGRGIVESVAWAPDGNSFALATSTEVDMYDAQTLEIVATLDTNKQWNKELAYSPNGRLLAVGGEKGTIQIWDPNSRKLIFTLRPIGSQPGYNTESEFSFSADGQQLVSGFNQSLSLWDLKTGTLVDSFPGYLNGVNQVAISPDGKVVLAAGGRTVSVRTVSSRELLYPPVSVKDDIVSVIMLPDGKQFVTISSEFLFDNNTTDVHYVSRIRTWDLLSGKLQNEQVLTQSRVESVAVNLKRHWLVLGQETAITVWDTTAQKMAFSLPDQANWVQSSAVSPDGQRLVSVDGYFANGDGAIQLWDLTNRKLLKRFEGYDVPPVAVAFSPDGKLAAVGGANRTTQVRETGTGQLLHEFQRVGGHVAFSPNNQTVAFTSGQPPDYPLTENSGNDYIVLANAMTGEYLSGANYPCQGAAAVAFSPDGKTLAFGGDNCDLQIRNIQTGALVQNFSAAQPNQHFYFNNLIFSPDGSKLVLGGSRIIVLDIQSGKSLQQEDANYDSQVTLSPDGRYRAVSSIGNYGLANQVEVWAVASNQLIFTLNTLQGTDTKLAFSPDGQYLVLAGKSIEWWNIWTGQPLTNVVLPENSWAGFAFAPDGRTLLAVGRDGSIQQWHLQLDSQVALSSHATPTALPTMAPTPVATIDKLTQMGELGKGYSSPVFHSPNGKLIAIVDSEGLKWFDATSLAQLGFVKVGDTPSPGQIIFSPDSQLVIVDGGFGAQIVDLASQQVVGRVSGGNGYTAGFTFTSDSKYLAYFIGDRSTGGPYEGIGVWSVVTRSNLYDDSNPLPTVLEGRYHTMSYPSISPDGNLIAAGHSDKRIYVWDLHTGKTRFVLEGHAAEVTAVAFSPDGKWLVSGSQDGTVRLWNPTNGHLIRVLTGFVDGVQDVQFLANSLALKVTVANEPDQVLDLATGRITPYIAPTPSLDPFDLKQYQQGFSAQGSSIFSSVLFSPTGKTLALASQNILLWDVASKKLVTFCDNSSGSLIRGVTFNSDSTLLAAATEDGNVLVWDAKTGRKIFSHPSSFLSGATFFYGVGDTELGPARGASSVAEQGLAFSSQGALLAFGNEHTIEIWDVNQSTRVADLMNPAGWYVTQLSFSADGSRLYAIINHNRSAQIWNTTSGTLIKQVDLPSVNPNAFSAVALSGSMFARNNEDAQGNGHIELWNLDTQQLTLLNMPSADNEPLRFSPDGSQLATINHNTLYFWKTATGQLVYQAPLHYYSSGIAISPDNHLLAIGHEGKATLFDFKPIAALAQQRTIPVLIPQATATPVILSWPSATPSPTLSAPATPINPDSVDINPENASLVREQARFGQGTLEEAAWSPAGDSIFTTGSLGLFQYAWQASAGKLSETAHAEHAGWSHHSVVLSDGQVLATSVSSGRVQVWDLSTSKTLVDVAGGGQPALSLDGRLLVYQNPDGQLVVWDIAKGKIRTTLKNYYYEQFDQPVFSPDGKWVAAIPSIGSRLRYRDSVRVWDVSTGTIINALGGPDNNITDLSFSAHGHFMVGAAGGAAWIWDMQPGTPPESIRLYQGEINGNLNLYTQTVTSAALSPDEQTVAVGTSEHVIWLYDRQSQRKLYKLESHSSSILHLSFSPDGKTLLSVDQDGTLIVWDTATGKRLSVLNDHSGPISGLLFGPDGHLIAWQTGVAWKIDTTTENLLHTTHIGSGTILAVSPDGNLLAGYDPYQVSLWDGQSGKRLQTLEGEAADSFVDYQFEGLVFRKFSGAAFTGDGSRMATAGTGGVWYYDMATKRLLQQFQGTNAEKIVLSPHGNLMASSLYQQVNAPAVFDLQTGTRLFEFDESDGGGSYIQYTFSPDERLLGAVKYNWDGPYELVLFDMASHQVYKRQSFGKDVALVSLAFNPAENLIALGQGDGKILLVDLSDLKAIATLDGHHGSVEHLVFSPDGRYLISGSTDGTIRTWGFP